MYDESLMKWPCMYQMMTGWKHQFYYSVDGIEEIGDKYDDDVKLKLEGWLLEFSRIFQFNTKYRFLFETNFNSIRLIETICGRKFVESSPFASRYEELQDVLQKIDFNPPRQFKIAEVKYLPRPMDIEDIEKMEKLGVREIWFRNIQISSDVVYVTKIAELKEIS